MVSFRYSLSKILLAAAVVAPLVVAPPANASTVTGVLALVEVTQGGNFGFRLYMTGYPTMCTGGANFAYLEPADSNYEAYVGTILTARATGATVTVYSTLVGAQCHIDRVQM